MAYKTFVLGKRTPWFMKVDCDFLFIHEQKSDDVTWADSTGKIQKYISVQRVCIFHLCTIVGLTSLGCKIF